MRARLKRLHSPDVPDLRRYQPSDPDDFSILVHAVIGPADGYGEELIEIRLCTPLWFTRNFRRGEIRTAEHYVFVSAFDYDAIWDFIAGYCDGLEGVSWQDIARDLGRLGWLDHAGATLRYN